LRISIHLQTNPRLIDDAQSAPSPLPRRRPLWLTPMTPMTPMANAKPPPLERGVGLETAAALLKIRVNLCNLRFSSPHCCRWEFPRRQIPSTLFPPSSPHAIVRSRARGVFVCVAARFHQAPRLVNKKYRYNFVVRGGRPDKLNQTIGKRHPL
jgi:hypothetical protein